MSNTQQSVPLSIPALPAHSSPLTNYVVAADNQFNQQYLPRHQQHQIATPEEMTPTFSQASLPGAPQSGSRQQAPPPPIDNMQFNAHQDHTTLVLGVLNYLERLEHEISEMREFVNLGYKKVDNMGDMDGGLSSRVEHARLQSRNWNRANITELDEPFKTLPRSTGEFPNDIPTTGEVLRGSPHKVIDHILDLYDIPFVPMMFLTEKKMLYLRFLGANRVIMHRILD